MKSASTRGVIFSLFLIYYVSVFSAWLRELVPMPSIDSRYLGLYVVISSVVSQVTSKLGRLKYMGRLAVLPTSGSELLQLVCTIVCAQLLSRLLVLVLNVNFLILFRATEFTVRLVLALASLPPIILLAVSPFIKKASWYYLMVYCTVCGGAVLLSGIWSTLLVGLVWRNLVVSKWNITSPF